MKKVSLFIPLGLMLVFSSHTQVQKPISYSTIFKGAIIGIASFGTCAASTLFYLVKKLQNKYVPRNDRLSAYYVQHDRYLHLFVQKNTDADMSKSCIMYLHGIGGHNKEMRTLLSDEQRSLLDRCDYIVPCIEFTNNADLYFAPFFNTDFGQEQDLLTALNALKTIFLPHVEKYEKLIIMGRSRGGAITTNLIGVLSTKGHYLLAQSGISELERLIILKKLVGGGVILSVPLISLEHAIQMRCGTILGSMIYRTMFSIITRNIYKVDSALKPLIMIKKWNNHKIPVFVIMATDDNIVGTKYNEQFLQEIENCNGVKPEVASITGGHKSGQIYTESVAALNRMLFGNTAEIMNPTLDYCNSLLF